MDKPQIILHSQKSVNYTVFDVKWIPTSAKFVALGNHARGTGALDIFEITHGDITLVSQVGEFRRHAAVAETSNDSFFASTRNRRRSNAERSLLRRRIRNDI